jgi:acyl-CoA thioesterase I
VISSGGGKSTLIALLSRLRAGAQSKIAGCTLVSLLVASLAPGLCRAQPEPVEEGLIVALGDSLTAGLGVDERDAWPAQLERRLHAAGYRWQVVNAGVSGETSSGARARLEAMLRGKPEIMVLATGANDGLRGVPWQVLYGNLDAMLTTLDESGVRSVVAGMQLPRNLGPNSAAAFARLYPELAQKHRAAFIPFLLEGVFTNPALLQADGLHPTAAGYRVVAELAYPRVLEAIGRVRADRMRNRSIGAGR